MSSPVQSLRKDVEPTYIKESMLASSPFVIPFNMEMNLSEEGQADVPGFPLYVGQKTPEIEDGVVSSLDCLISALKLCGLHMFC